MTDLLLTPQQAARRLCICQRTLLEHVKAQELDAIHVGRGRLRRRLRFDPADLDAFNERRKAEARQLIGGQGPCQSTSTKNRRSTTLTSNTSFYHFDFQYKGRRFHGSTGATALAAAKRVEAEERQKAIAETAIEARETARGKRSTAPMTLVAVVGRYWSEIGAHQVRSDQVLWSLNWLTDYFGDGKLINEIDGSEISKMVAKRRGERVRQCRGRARHQEGREGAPASRA